MALDDVVPRGFVVFALGVDFRVNDYSAEHVGSFGIAAVGVLHDEFGDVAGLVAACFEKLQGVSVTIDASLAAFEIVMIGEISGALPVEETFFDGFAFRVMADLAFAGVPFGVDGCCCGMGIDELLVAWGVAVSSHNEEVIADWFVEGKGTKWETT